MEKIHFRIPLPEESDAMWQLALRSKQHWGYDDNFMHACREELSVSPEKLSNPRFTYRVGVIHNELIGFYCLDYQDNKTAEIDALFIEPGYIGTGSGRLFWQNLVYTARQKGLQNLTIASDPYAEAFYLKMGAVRVGEIASGSVAGRSLPLLEYPVAALDTIPQQDSYL